MSRKRFEAVVNSAYDGIISVNSESRIELINTAACEMFGVDESYLGKRLETLLPQRFRANHDGYFRPSATPHQLAPHACPRLRDGAAPRRQRISAGGDHRQDQSGPDHRDDRHPARYLGAARLVEELKVAATTDPLTGIANRRRFDELVKLEMQRCQRFGHTMSLLLIDIDHFKGSTTPMAISKGSGHSQPGKTGRQTAAGGGHAGPLGWRGVHRAAAGNLAGAGLGQCGADPTRRRVAAASAGRRHRGTAHHQHRHQCQPGPAGYGGTHGAPGRYRPLSGQETGAQLLKEGTARLP